MAEHQKNFLTLFERPYEQNTPSHGGMGPEFIVPPVTVNEIRRATTVPRDAPFAIFMDSHNKAAMNLVDYFMKCSSPEELVDAAKGVRGMLNETLFVYALSYVVLNKRELRSLTAPSIVEVFPGKFFTSDTFRKVKEQLKLLPQSNLPKGQPLEIDGEFSGSLSRSEYRISYWREDYGINTHHWHWHLVNPGPSPHIHRDRKGELFYYMHNQMVARYDWERLSNRLDRVKAISGLDQPLEDGYFSKLNINNSSMAWGTRQDNTTLRDVTRPDFVQTISEMKNWADRLQDAIHMGYMHNREGEHVKLSDDDVPPDGKRGIEMMGDTVEADSGLSVNRPFYGNLHNMGHMVIAYSHDPDGAHKEQEGVMGENTTAVRDSAFFRWHKYIDGIFQMYKRQQKPYTEDDLKFEGVEVTRVEVTQGTNQPNTLQTDWNTVEFDIHHGLDFKVDPEREIKLKVKRMDHQPFTYKLKLNNKLSGPKKVYVRIFMAPLYNEARKQMNFMDQRLVWAEMDKFTVMLKSGENDIERLSLESSVTTTDEPRFSDFENGRYVPQIRRGLPNSGSIPVPSSDLFDRCGCGWPQHMLLPRGYHRGMDFQLFVMVTDYDKDKVDNPGHPTGCTDGASFCGILNAKYPDKRPMGFPFDRESPVIDGDPIDKVDDLANNLENVFVQRIKIAFIGHLLGE